MTQYTEKDKKFLKALKDQGVDASTALARLEQVKKSQPQQSNPIATANTIGSPDFQYTPKPKEGYFSGIGTAAKEGYQDQQNTMADIRKRQASGELNALEAFPRYLGAGIQSILPVSRGLGKAVEPVVEPVVKKGLQFVDQTANLMTAPYGSKGTQPAIISGALGRLAQTLKKGAETNPDIANALQTAESLGLFAGGGFGTKQAAEQTGKIAAKTALKEAGETALGLVPKSIRKTIKKGLKIADKRGIPKPDARRIVTATPDEFTSFQKMFRIALQNLGARGPQVRPNHIIGKDIVDMASFLSNKARTIGALKAKGVAKVKDKLLNITEAIKPYERVLDNLNIVKKADGSLDYRKSKFASNTELQKLLNTINKRIRPNTKGEIIRTPEFLDTVRGEIFDLAKLGKAQKLFGTQADRAVSKFRSSLVKPLEAVAPGYKNLSKEYAQIKKNLTETSKLIGHKGPIDDISKSALNAGEVSRRVLSERSAQARQILNNLQNLAKQQGFKDKGSIIKKVQFADMLEDFFGTTQSTGYKGQTARAQGNAIDKGVEVVSDAVSAVSSPVGLAQAGNKVIKALTGKTPKKQLAALKSLLKIK